MQILKSQAELIEGEARTSPEQILLSNPGYDPDRLARAMRRAEPTNTFCIFFTARSGSTWLGDTLGQTDLLGRPKEWFNPKFVQKALVLNNAPDLSSYIDVLRRKQQRGGVFSFEITNNQILRVFGSDEAFLQFFPATTPAFWLTREDIVQQAISLAKAAKSSVFHSARASVDEILNADDFFTYDIKDISLRVERLLEQEKATEAFFQRHGILPHRLTYEQSIAAGAEVMARQFLKLLRPDVAEGSPLPDLVENFRKIGSSKNIDFAERFRKDRPDLIEKVESFRAKVAISLQHHE